MNTTLENNDVTNKVYQQAREDTQKKFNALLNSLPKETASDLVELFQQYAKTDDKGLQSEIIQTIEEILMPETMQVELREEFELSHEDAYVRNKLSAYRLNVGKVIKDRRTELGMNQIELAEKAGISQSHICRLETGVHVPTSVTIEKVAKALGTSPSQIDPGFYEDQ